MYANAPLVGFLYGRTAEQDDTRNPETNQVYNQNVMSDRVIYSQEELNSILIDHIVTKIMSLTKMSESTRHLSTWEKILMMKLVLTVMFAAAWMFFMKNLLRSIIAG